MSHQIHRAPCISIHGPRVGADADKALFGPDGKLFQSTAPVWGPTNTADCVTSPTDISIHGPRVGGRLADPFQYVNGIQFQSTAPVWGPTRSSASIAYSVKISIHGPRVGADTGTAPEYGSSEFQSTAPVWGPTRSVATLVCGEVISIHGPRVGADAGADRTDHLSSYFNPRPPCGGRLFISWSTDAAKEFQSTAPVWGPTVLATS